jgi:hypothetical protein
MLVTFPGGLAGGVLALLPWENDWQNRKEFMAGKIAAGILGATGSAGQWFIQLLEDHP